MLLARKYTTSKHDEKSFPVIYDCNFSNSNLILVSILKTRKSYIKMSHKILFEFIAFCLFGLLYKIHYFLG